ncbi:4-coumarate--CoA ligase-like 5 [Abeliophyllum distichum]|uniref:4-coumarate--CoA ligase-like 5 n=1 Tax=Abeliophyllum distichum TaxID=126358 RepID=A0ABD1V5B2_9LAMI
MSQPSYLRDPSSKIAFIDSSTGRQLSFSDVWRVVDADTTCLSANMNIHKNNIVLLLSSNSIYFSIVCLSIMSLDAIITTTNYLNTSPKIAKQISISKLVLTFTISQLLPKLADSKLPIVFFDFANSYQ